MELLELIQTLNAAHGPSGDEGGIREKLAELARPLADEISTDTMGNLIVRKLGSGPRVMLCAHMDSIGFIVTHVEENGFLRVGRLGGISPKEAAYTPVRFASGVRGVIVPEEKADLVQVGVQQQPGGVLLPAPAQAHHAAHAVHPHLVHQGTQQLRRRLGHRAFKAAGPRQGAQVFQYFFVVQTQTLRFFAVMQRKP